MSLDGMTYLSVRGTRMLEHLHGRAANDQLPVLDVPLLTVLELVDEQAAQFRDVLGAGGVVDIRPLRSRFTGTPQAPLAQS